MSRWNKSAACFLSAVVLAVSVALPPAFAQEDTEVENPRFEIGAGVSGLRFQSRPEWTGKYMGTLFGMASMRLLYGLSVQGMGGVGNGSEPYPDFIPYESGVMIKTNAGTYCEEASLGLRYDIPATAVTRAIDTLASVARLRKRDPLATPRTYAGIDYICPSVGIVRTAFSVKGNRKLYIETEEFEYLDSNNYFKLADANGVYAGVAVRWRLDTDYTENADSWFGSYGIDVGARYIRYNDCNLHSASVQPAKSYFNSYQVYLVGFMKFKLFY